MKYQVTGNEYISLPTIREDDGGLEGISFLHMGCKGMIEICGGTKTPLLQPFIEICGKRRQLTQAEWTLDGYWIPSFTASACEAGIAGTWLAPLGERGFGCRLEIEGRSATPVSVRFGLEGCWSETLHSINESKPINAEKYAYDSDWNHNVVFDIRPVTSLFAFAPIFAENIQYTYEKNTDGTISYTFYKDIVLAQEQKDSETFWFGLGYEEVAAATSAKEMLRQGFGVEYQKTRSWLAQRQRSVGEDKLDTLLNQNMFFSFFYGSGLTLDTEEFVLVTSRSSRYYVSAAYWDRDSLLWSFPAILMTDADFAHEMLHYVFTRQIKNVGIHSRYIDGTVLEPGFELDELCAPILALMRYVKVTGNYALLNESYIRSGVDRILNILKSKKHPDTDLYETFLQPTDDMNVYKYITYDNVLVWRILSSLSEVYDRPDLEELAERVRASIITHCVKEKNGRSIYAWSVDLEGNWDIYDEPPGSLLLLPYYGFCSKEDSVWVNTVSIIRDPSYPYSFADYPIAEIGCPHAPHPWVLSIANSLLSGNIDMARKHLELCKMDNGIACESVDEYTGESRSGDAFATCAGFLAYAINSAFTKGGGGIWS